MILEAREKFACVLLLNSISFLMGPLNSISKLSMAPNKEFHSQCSSGRFHQSKPTILAIIIKDYPNKKKKKKKSSSEDMCCCSDCCDCECRPLGFLLGLPFALVCLILSLVGVVIWIVGITLSCLCPCCICVTAIVELAIALIKAPFSVMKWFTEQIPC